MFHNPGVLGMHVFGFFFQSVHYIPINTTLGQEKPGGAGGRFDLNCQSVFTN